jgi:hypothetical protein
MMVLNATHIQKGMDVFGSDEEKVGSVSAVYPDAGAAGPEGASHAQAGTTALGDTVLEDAPRGSTEEPGPAGSRVAPEPLHITEPTSAFGGGPGGYFRVDQGGVLGVGTKHLYIPLSAVCDVIPGQRVTVTYTKDQVSNIFDTRPETLGDEEADNAS